MASVNYCEEAIITYKQKLVSLTLFILSVGAAGIAWNGFIKSNSCDYIHATIERQVDDQSDLLITYAFLAHPDLGEDRKQAFEKILDSREIPIRKRIEHFKELCHTGLREAQLKIMLASLQLYNTTKQAVFKEEQGSFFRWIQKIYPAGDDIEL